MHSQSAKHQNAEKKRRREGEKRDTEREVEPSVFLYHTYKRFSRQDRVEGEGGVI